MKIPFRYQATEYDCVPTTFINALQYLFDRDEIPPVVIQKIMQYSLDTVNKRGEFGKGGGTTALAVQMILQWFESYSNKSFAFRRCEYLPQEQIHLRQGNKIMSCVNCGGVALLCVCFDNSGTYYHYLLALGVDEKDSGYLNFFDPYFRVKNFTNKESDSLQWLGNSDRQEPNLRISRRHLDSDSYTKYSMGPIHVRECCLLERQN